jgi:hypothetical protein
MLGIPAGLVAELGSLYVLMGLTLPSILVLVATVIFLALERLFPGRPQPARYRLTQDSDLG